MLLQQRRRSCYLQANTPGLEYQMAVTVMRPNFQAFKLFWSQTYWALNHLNHYHD